MGSEMCIRDSCKPHQSSHAPQCWLVPGILQTSPIITRTSVPVISSTNKAHYTNRYAQLPVISSTNEAHRTSRYAQLPVISSTNRPHHTSRYSQLDASQRGQKALKYCKTRSVACGRCTHAIRGRSRMTTDPRIPPIPVSYTHLTLPTICSV